ncbi:MAG: T9SS type A sorting domain-containing protein [Bacteroidales bacterium]|nr:T9SS type A sorting domain-containing protein [Bacteroidales bacterium]
MKKFTPFILSLFFILSLSYTAYSQGMSYHKTKPSVLIIHATVLIYPNPVTNNKFFVKSEQLIKKVEVMNILGQNIKTVTNETNVPYNILVEIGNIKKGMYMVQVTLDTGEKLINKIIVK